MRTADGSIIHKCLNGDTTAFGLLVDKYRSSVYALAYSKLHNFHDAEDVAQEVFIKAYRNLSSLKQFDRFHAWLYAITSNLCKDWIKAKTRRPDDEFIWDQDQKTLEEPSMNSYREELIRESVYDALDSLPDNYQQVITLYYLAGMDSKEIAEFLGTSHVAIRHRLSRARSQLKEGVFAMMNRTFEENKLPASFTFRIAELIKNARIQSIPRITGLSWGLPLAMSLIFAAIISGPYLNVINTGANHSNGTEQTRLDPDIINTSEDFEIMIVSDKNESKKSNLNDSSEEMTVFLLDSESEDILLMAKSQDIRSENRTISIELPGLPEDARKLEMVFIQAGTFIMGSPVEETGRSDEEWPSHKVTISRPFYMGKFEVTQAQWEAIMGKNRSWFRDMPNNPVERVSRHDCQKFINRLNALGQGAFRLPTEAEWEYACRAGTKTPFSFDPTEADKYLWWRGNNKPDGTKEVGLKLSNPWGLCDMHGNVHEWCLDKWEPAYNRGARTDPVGKSFEWIPFGLLEKYVFRGGAYATDLASCRSAYRRFEQFHDYHKSLGLRLVREHP